MEYATGDDIRAAEAGERSDSLGEGGRGNAVSVLPAKLVSASTSLLVDSDGEAVGEDDP